MSEAANPPEWVGSLPEEIRADPILAQVPDVPTLAKNYINAQRLIGTKRLPEPQQNWTDAEWQDLYSKLGRPETPDKYTIPELKLESGLSLSEDRLKAAREMFHKHGLSDKQAKGILEYYGNLLNDQVKSIRTTSETNRAKAMEEVTREFGDKTDAKLDIARGVIKKFGDENLAKYLEQNELGNNVGFIKTLVKIGEAMMEDSTRGGGGGVISVKDSTSALREIDSLKVNKEFMDALNSTSHMGHAAALQRWIELHKVAYPGAQE